MSGGWGGEACVLCPCASVMVCVGACFKEDAQCGVNCMLVVRRSVIVLCSWEAPHGIVTWHNVFVFSVSVVW